VPIGRRTQESEQQSVPTYEYRCKDCEHTFDVVQAFTDDALTECPSCGGTLRKVFGNVGITFKGSGFYKTDSRSSSNGKKTDAAKSNGDASKSESSTTSESKKEPSSTKSDSGSKSTTPA
jgi:putative FmdB family regulatory protein